MKRFVLTVLGAAVFFTGVGAVVENAGAKFKSDERALELVRKARVAIGGDGAINAVQSMRIVGSTTRTVKMNGVEKASQGETEIALQLPDKMMKMIKMGNDDGIGHIEHRIDKQVDVVVVGKDKMNVSVDRAAAGDGTAVTRKIVIRKDDGTVQELTGDEAAKWIAEHPVPAGAHTFTVKKKADGTVEHNATGEHVVVRKGDGGTATFTSKDGKTFNIDGKDVILERTAAPRVSKARSNELLRTTLSLLLTAPQGMDISYTYSGEGNVDGTACDIVVASFAGTSYKLYLSRSSSLPVMMSYSDHKAPMVFARTAAPKDGEPLKEKMVFTRTAVGHDLGAAVEFNVKFSDFRSTAGVQLPYKWTTTVGGATDEVFDVTSYEINPANIGEKFQHQNVMVRTKKPDSK